MSAGTIGLKIFIPFCNFYTGLLTSAIKARIKDYRNTRSSLHKSKGAMMPKNDTLSTFG